jgi:hypothetical protein
MLLTDLTVEVRDENLNRVAQLVGPELVGATFVSRFNNVGSWSVSIPNGFPNAELLRTPGYGIILTGPQGVILSGPTLSAQLEQGTEDPQGVWVIKGADDSIVLEERLAYPTPTTADVTEQTIPRDIRTGAAETVLKEYVDVNIGPNAPSQRQIPTLTIEDDDERGLIVFGSARFPKLQELLFGLAAPSGIGYTIKQDQGVLVFSVYEPLDRTAEVRMDIANNQVTRTEYSYANPKTTRAIVAGPGEAEERLFIEGTSPESVEAESVWGRRMETFIDSRGTEELDELNQSAEEELTENGTTIVNISVSPTDDTNMRYGFDWGLGDKVTVVVDQTEAQAVVTEVGISIETDGVRVGATVGNPTSLDFESKLIQKAQVSDKRISNLERNAAGPGSPIRGQVSRQTTGTITISTAGVYVSTGLTATFDSSVSAGMALGTTDTFAVKKTAPGKRFIRVYGSMDARAGNNKTLGVKLALNGVAIDESECRAFTGSSAQEAKLVTSWIIEMDQNDEVALYAANISDTVNIDLQRARIVATAV